MGGGMAQHWARCGADLKPCSADDFLGDAQSPGALAAHQHNKVGANSSSFQAKNTPKVVKLHTTLK